LGGTWRKPTTAGELFRDYICERGPKDVYFNGNDTLTKKLSRSILLDEIRREYYGGNGKYPKEQRFGSISKYIKEWADLLVDQEFPLVHVLGSVDVSVAGVGGGRVRFWVHNRTDLASGTHFIGRFPPEGQAETPYSLEDYVRDHPDQAGWSAGWLINTHSEIVSILSPRVRSETLGGMGGGNYDQTFVWSERYLGCEMQNRPWPVYLQLLDVQVYYQDPSAG
jgi:hypothetical protein